MAKIERFPVTRIHSLAVRNFRSINELQTYEFSDGLNSISGGNVDGKSAILNAIRTVLNPHVKHRCSSFWGFGFMGHGFGNGFGDIGGGFCFMAYGSGLGIRFLGYGFGIEF